MSCSAKFVSEQLECLACSFSFEPRPFQFAHLPFQIDNCDRGIPTSNKLRLHGDKDSRRFTASAVSDCVDMRTDDVLVNQHWVAVLGVSSDVHVLPFKFVLGVLETADDFVKLIFHRSPPQVQSPHGERGAFPSAETDQ